MSFQTPPGSPESDLLRRLQAQESSPLETRVASVETAVQDHEYRLGGHDNRLDTHDNQLAAHGSRLTAAENTLVLHEGRLDAAESTLTNHDGRITTAEGTLVTYGGRLDILEALPFIAVRTAAELTAAMAFSRFILIVGPITVTSAVKPTQPYTHLWGVAGAKLTRAHVNGSAVNVIEVEVPYLHIKGIELTTGHPLTSDTGYASNDTAIAITSDAAKDWSWLTVEDVYIHHVAWGIRRWPGASGSAVAEGVRLINVRIRSFCQGGIELNWRMKHLRMEHIRIYGRVGAEDHTVGWNGIWLGNYCDLPLLDDVYVDEVDRHGVELWNSQSPPNTNGNLNPHLRNIRIGKLGRHVGVDGSFGVTVIGNGVIKLESIHIDECVGTGIELNVDSVNTGRYQLTDFSIGYVKSAANAVGISVNGRDAVGTLRAEISDGFVGRCESTNGALESYGMQFLAGCAKVLLSRVHFEDAGNRQLYVNGNGSDPFKGISAEHCVFTWTAAAPSRGYNVAVSLQNLMATAVLRNCVVYRPTGALVGYYRINGTGAVRTGGNGYAAITASGPDLDASGESNLTIDL